MKIFLDTHPSIDHCSQQLAKSRRRHKPGRGGGYRTPKNGGLERAPECRLITLMRTFQSGSPEVGL